MSELIVEVSRIMKVFPHPNADRLELAHIKGWQCVVAKGKYAAGQLVTYIPPDSILPVELSDRIGVTQYLSKGRVRCAKLRGEPSFGIVMDLEDHAWTEGTDVAEHYGITKYEPPKKGFSGGGSSAKTHTIPAHPAFPKYTDLANLRHHPDAFEPGETVVATEKIHGTSVRVGLVEGEWMAGSRNRQVEVSTKPRSWWKWLLRRPVEHDWDACAKSWFTYPLSHEPVRRMLRAMAERYGRQSCPAVYGEVYGNVQGLKYGLPAAYGFRAFDILLNGKFLDYSLFASWCQASGVEVAPRLYSGPYTLDAIKSLAEGDSTLPGANHIREGVVVRPINERSHPRAGRLVLKYVGDGYLLGDVSDETIE